MFAERTGVCIDEATDHAAVVERLHALEVSAPAPRAGARQQGLGQMAPCSAPFPKNRSTVDAAVTRGGHKGKIVKFAFPSHVRD
eukprot:7920687-Pyramimonas_sp.AAC.1